MTNELRDCSADEQRGPVDVKPVTSLKMVLGKEVGGIVATGNALIVIAGVDGCSHPGRAVSARRTRREHHLVSYLSVLVRVVHSTRLRVLTRTEKAETYRTIKKARTVRVLIPPAPPPVLIVPYGRVIVRVI